MPRSSSMTRRAEGAQSKSMARSRSIWRAGGSRTCEDVADQTPAPARLSEGGLPAEATVAHVVIGKYTNNLPLYHHAQVYPRQGNKRDLSTLSERVGGVALRLRPVHAHLLATLKREPIFAYTIPSKIQSYLACGKPLIVALEGEGARIVQQAGAGWSVPPEDPRALADAVLAASRLSKSERDAMGNRGEACFREHFEREKVLSRLEAELDEAVSGA